MKFEITSIAAAGDIERERIVLTALADCDIGSFVMLRTSANKMNNKVLGANVPSAYWFPDQKIRKGDVVVLYTKKGGRSQKPNEAAKNTSHFFYWGLDGPIWSVPNHRAVLLEGSEWESYKEPFPEDTAGEEGSTSP